MNIKDFDYELPEELIAQRPSEKRDFSRLMVVDRKSGSISHEHFYNVIDHLVPGDVLVMNDSRVIPARLSGVKEGTNAKAEFLLSRRITGDTWETLVRPGKKLKPGDFVTFGEGDLRAEITGYGEEGTRTVRFIYEGDFTERLRETGNVPLPPYIKRNSDEEDRERYQTVYANYDGSVAAPTAGLHFTKELLQAAGNKGVETVYVTLHVGIGTFRPVKAENIEDHHMHFEEYYISGEAADTVNRARDEGRRVIAVGTTSARTLESAAFTEDGRSHIRPGHEETGIFIYPGYKFRIVDSLITNFHLPKSTLIMLVSAFYDREKVLEAYREAVREKYRFFSYGDAMMLI